MHSPEPATSERALVPKPHYPFITKLLIDLFNSGELPNILSVDVEPVYGYVGRMIYRDRAVRFFRGSSMGINRLGASEVARDKGYTKYFLGQLGYRTPPGRVFLLPDFAELIGRNLARFGFDDFAHSRDMLNYIEKSLGYPCYIKPNEGSQGRGIECCHGPDEVRAAMEQHVAQGANKVLVEKAVPFPDYRVVVMGGEMISCYLRKPLELTGDGISTVDDLLRERQARFEREGRDTIIDMDDSRIEKGIQRMGWQRHTVPRTGRSWRVFEVSNLSVGGDSEDFTEAIHPGWRRLCIEVAAAMGLRLCGVDLACENICDGDADYSILEINAAPGLDNYAATGAAQAARVRELYRRAFNESVEV
jgi:D-alanine-D-alanine ligase-like ATP-grasp enzyme